MNAFALALVLAAVGMAPPRVPDTVRSLASDTWINGRPDLRGRVIVLEFWTYG